jgi:peptide deformylase
MTLNIINFPNPILSETMPVFDFDNPTIDPKELEKNLIDTMLANKGVGLSANQVGIKANVFVMGHSSDPASAQAFFNPVIISASKDHNDMVEGCLSFPGVFLKVKRPSRILARWQNSDGEWQESEFKGYDAKCFCHEYDHLNSINMSDRVSQLRWALAVKKSRKIGKY